MKFLIMFVVLSIINVTFSTVRSITTIKGGKVAAALMSGGYFAFYNIMLIWTTDSSFPMWQKCIITFGCNVVGVFLVKFFEEKAQKDKLWKVEATCNEEDVKTIYTLLSSANISCNSQTCFGHHAVFNIFCNTKQESQAVKEILKQFKVKYFVSESKML